MVIKNPNEIYIPDYLNEQFFVNALEEGLRETKLTISEINFEWGSNPGDNYCSRIYRALVTFERLTPDQKQRGQEQLSLIIKAMPITEGMRFLEDASAFLTEKLTFLDVLPRLQILGDGYQFGANCYYSIKAPTQTLVFNDLKVDGFIVASRQNQLDWAHCELILRQLGRMHATSMVLAKRDPAIPKRLTQGLLCEETIMKSDTFLSTFGGTLKQLAINAENWPGFEKIAQKLHHFHNNFRSICSRLGERREGDRYVVMNHGDFWIGNLLFAYDDPKQPTKPTRGLFVDFQFNFYGSPACDLNFFLNASVPLNLLEGRREDLINVYFKTFTETLENLHYESIPTLEDLKYELRARELYGLFSLFGFLPITVLPKELSTDSSIENMMDGDFVRQRFEKLFAQERIQAQLKYGLQRFEDLGVLDEF